MSEIQSHVEVLRPKAGDTIVVHIEANFLTADQREWIHRLCVASLPDSVKVMILDRSMRLTHIVTADALPAAETEAEPIHFDTWMRERTERAHREYMARIRRRLPCDVTTEEIYRYMNVQLD
jgi:hypothetical protein